MREIYDPVYYPPVIQGFDDYRHHPPPQQYRRPPPQYQPPPPVAPKSSSGSSSSSSSVLGKFLKLGKSKSDVSGGSGLFSSSGLLSPSAGSTSGTSAVSRGGGGSGRSESCELDDFRLSPSVISRGPVQKMVHNKANKRDVSRSHSWIYGSVKLASDLPFGYGDQFSTFQGGDTQMMGMEDPHSGGGGGGNPQSHYLHTHGLHAMQIPRCQLPEYSCTCDCGGREGAADFGMGPGGSMRNGPSRRVKPPCQGCAREMAMKYALPKGGRGGTAGGGNSSESFVSSVRKLTWKSLKQVVKKRPSLDTLKKIPPQQHPAIPPTEYLSAPIVPMPYLSPSAVAAASATQPHHHPPQMREPPQNMNPMANPQNHYGHGGVLVQSPPMSPTPQQQPPQPDYFFPEKKQFYASCNDIYEKGGVVKVGPSPPPNHVTASVRVRPKRTRQPWQFPSAAPSSEFGPVPNYEEDGGNGNPSGLYHSEWDLRNVMSYDMWMNATSNVKPRTGAVNAVPHGPPSSNGGGSSSASSKHSGRSHSADARHYHSSGNLHLPPPDYGTHLEPPTTFRPLKQQSSKTSSGKTITNGKGSVSSSKSLTSLHSPLPSSSSVISASSSSGPKGGSISSSQSSDTLKISTFANSPSNPNKSPNAGIIKRSSILAADVTAYQLLKQQKKKASQSSSSSVASSTQSPSHSSSKGPSSTSTSVASTRTQSILKNKQMPIPAPQPPPVDLEDAFSESSDDLSDNAVNGPSSVSDSASMKSRSSSSAGTTGANLGVRIAGQGIRMVPNTTKTNTTVINCTPPPQKSPSVSSVTPTTSNARAHTKRESGQVSSVGNRGLSPESDMWSDCHDQLAGTQRRNSNGATITTVTNGAPMPTKTCVKVNGNGGNGQTGVASNGKRQTFVTFEKQPPPPPQLPPVTNNSAKQSYHPHEADMEFEEYEVDHHRRQKDKISEQKTTSISLSSSKSLAENKVSLNVTTAAPSGTHPPKATYIKHNKSSSTSPTVSTSGSSNNASNSSSSTSAKFGALRRRKNRSVQGSGCTSPGKLLQETIYEEEDPEVDHDGGEYDDELNENMPQRGQSPHHLNHPSSRKSSSERHNPPKHSVKIMVGAGAQTQSSSTTTVKPILKNHQRSAYETPVAIPSSVSSSTNNGASYTSDSCSNDISNYFNNNSSKFHPLPSESKTDDQIYFDSSVSTTSTKKKVQFDQSKVVVCGGSSASSSSAGSGPEEEEEEPYDYENDDSDQWSNKSSEEEEERDQQQQQQVLVTVVPSPPSQQQPLSQQPKIIQREIEPVSTDVHKATTARARSLFEEEVARKAASMAKSRQQKQEQEEADIKTNLIKSLIIRNTNKNRADENVNNLDEQQRRLPQQSNGYSDGAKETRTAGAVVKNTTTPPSGFATNKNATNSQGNGTGSRSVSSGAAIQPCQNYNNRKDAAAVVIVSTGKGSNKNSTTANNNDGKNNAPPKLSTFQQQQHNARGKISSTKVSGNVNVGSPAAVIVNPNSLLFHDTTRIRLNQTRPALHDSTFKLPNGNGSASQTPPSPNGSTRSSRGITRLKQSNSFRSVSSVALRPREPPPPPPSFTVASVKGSFAGSSLSSMPARLQKALSTSTLLSKSTEKLHLTSGSASNKNGGGSHYGPGGRLLPSKSQISLPVSVTTTSKTAGLLASSAGSSVSMETLHVTNSPTTVTASAKRRDKNCASLASRSKSLTDRCSALEKVLQEQKRAEHVEQSHYRKLAPQQKPQLRPAPSLPCLSSPLPKDDMDSKSIEIVTKENDVSEIRIYSASNVAPHNNSGGLLDDENLPYQGIIYESTKTIITNDSPPPPIKAAPVVVPPPVGSPPKSAVPPPRPAPPEIHYAATDLFPASQPTQQVPQQVPSSQKVSTPKSSPPVPFSHPPLPPIPSSAAESEYECTGKSVVLFIDNGSKKKPDQVVTEDSGLPLTNYSQPIDTIPRGSHRQHPQTPLPSIPAHASDDMGEPLYDDVVNHSFPDPPPPVPKSLGTGSVGRKSLKGVVISPPHQLGELPPLPPPPVPPHRTPLPTSTVISTTTTSHHEVISSTLPCLACPPSLPPPNLPSKSLSEFHNRPLVIQENEEESLLEEEVDNLYNDIGTPSNTLKSSTAASFASAMKEAILGAIGGNKRNSGDFSDRRSVHSTGSGSSSSGAASGGVSITSKKLITSVVGGEQQPQLIYDDTVSISSSGAGSSSSASSCGVGGGSSRIISHQPHNAPAIKKTVPQQMVPLPPTPAQQQLSNKSSQKLEQRDEPEEEPLYDDVLNLSEQTEITSNNSINSKKDIVSPTKKLINAGGSSSSGASEYHSSNSSDSGTEDLPPPLPAQGPPPLPKELPLLTFPLITPTQQPPPVVVQSVSTTISSNEIGGKDEAMTTSRTTTSTRSTRTLLTELNEKLSKLNVTSGSSTEGTSGRKTTEANNNMPCSSSSTSPGGSSVDASSGEFNSDSFHISKVVISPSSESSGVEEDYNSERNYSLSLGGSRSSSNGSGSSSGGSDNENGYGNNNVNNKKKATSTSSGTSVAASNVQQKGAPGMPSEAISMARGKFLENMKLSMLGGASSPSTPTIGPSSTPSSASSPPRGLLMMSRPLMTVPKNGPTADPVEIEQEPEEEPIYEEIGDNMHNSKNENVSPEAAVLMMMTSMKAATRHIHQHHQHSTEEADDDEDDDRSASPMYADAFDAKSMFDGASRSEILSFLESIRDRLTGAESATSTSDSQSSSISRSSTTAGVAKASVVTEDSSVVSGVVEDKGGRNVGKERRLSLVRGDGGHHGRIPEADEMEEIGLDEQHETQEMQLAGDSAGILVKSALPQAEEEDGHGVGEEIRFLEKEQKLLCRDCNDDIEESEEGEQNNNNQHKSHQFLHHQQPEDDPTVTTGLAHPGGNEVSPSTDLVVDCFKNKCCRSCNRKRNEKKEIIMEIYETELKYGRDLRIVSEEFYKPIQVAGLLTKEQLDQIFLNVDQLIQINLTLTGRLKTEIQRSQQRKLSLMSTTTTTNDGNVNNNKKEDELSEVNVGKIFLELGETMMTAFENYCTRQASAGALLSQLEKEKELLRIFLRVSQMENTVLRRMNLPAFLMVPVQRVTRYPLLLSRLLKVTPVDHFSRDELQSAQEKIEQHLEHMNKTTREVASVKLWRRISIINGSSSNGPGGAHRRSNSDLDTSNIRIRKMALDVLDWTGFNDVTCVLDNQLGGVHFNGKLMRNIYGCLLVRGKDLDLLASKIQDQDPFFPPAAEDVVKDVKLVLVRVKNTRFCLLREPLCLSKCVVSQGENEFQEFIEINEITTKNTYFIQGLDKQGTGSWLRFLQCYAACVGHWRRRRPALANIMMNGMIKHL